ncbi:MAG: ISL3 family transposase [Bacilli bacterium]|nr:ISL3 family transposase [Bacilli bacterium]
MDFNTLFLRFGLDSSNFVNQPIKQVPFADGYIYETEEEVKERICPYCHHPNMHIHTYKYISIKLTSTIRLKEELRIKRIRYKCPNCHRTHTFDLIGIERNKTISKFTKLAMQNEFFEIQSLSTIAKRYGVSLNTVINIFDEYTKVMPRGKMPEFLCIDEKHFEGDTEGKYCVVISDFFTGKVIDVLSNRQMPYLDEYFSKIPIKERENTKVFISDMYDGYSSIQKKYFPKSIFVVDLFHVIKILTEAVKKIRIRTYNQVILDDTIERHFMKHNWKVFLCDQYKIRNNTYHSEKYNETLSYGEIILRCVKTNYAFWDGYNILQEILHYDLYETYSEAERFINRIIAKLNSSGDDLLCKVASTYQRWKVGIINGLARNQTGRRFSNAIAENNNSHIQRIINVAYGYKNFKRFRGRIMLILSYKNQR